MARPFSFSVMLLSVFVAAMNVRAATDEPPRDRLLHLLERPHSNVSLDNSGYKGARFRTFRDDDVASPTFGTELCVLEAPSGGGGLHVKILNVNGSPTAVYERPFAAKALGVITGGFFGVSDKGRPVPIGLVKSEGENKNRRHPWNSGGMVVASLNSVKIIPVRDYTDSPSHLNVIQSKPLLVEDGRDGIKSSNFDRFDRSAVALTRNGDAFLFVIHSPGGNASSLAEFSQLLLKFRGSTDSPIRDALAMDGGPGAHLFVPALKRHCGAGTPNFIPNVIFFSK